MLHNQHIGAHAANVAIEQVIAYAANAAIDTNAAMQSGMLQSWQRQSRCDANAAMGHRMLKVQQYGLAPL